MKTLLTSGAILILFSLSSLSPKDNCGTYRWFVKTLTDPDGEAVYKMKAKSTTIETLLKQPRTAPPHETDAKKRYDDEKQVVKIEVTIMEIKQEADHDFHIVLASGAHTMVGEIPDGTCGTFESNPALAKHFDDLRQAVIKAIGFTPEATIKKVNKKATIEGVPFWDEMEAGHKPTGSSPTQREIHPILKLTFQ